MQGCCHLLQFAANSSQQRFAFADAAFELQEKAGGKKRGLRLFVGQSAFLAYLLKNCFKQSKIGSAMYAAHAMRVHCNPRTNA